MISVSGKSFFTVLIMLSILTWGPLNASFAQQLLSERYGSIMDESKKYNEEIAAYYYKEIAIGLAIARNKSTLDYSKMYMFFDEKCISETHYYPRINYNDRFKLLKAVYGEPTVYDNVSNWIDNGLHVTITVAFSKQHGKEVCMINYAYLDDHDKILSVIQKTQTPYTRVVKIKAK